VPQAAQYHKQGKVKALAVTSAQRNQALPDTPTVIEQGIKGFEVVGFYGVLAPANMPKEITNKLSGAFKTILETPDIRNRMITQGADPAFLGSDEFTAFLGQQMPIWAKAVKQSGAKQD
jgi:tripartite-type tricarboxylate transporter receptor subunit TctC